MKNDKYQIAYTFKSPGDTDMSEEFFKTKKEANTWLKKNKKKIYWHQLTEMNPKSLKPLPIIEFDPPERYTKKIGTLETFFETGMECLGLIFYEDGVYGGPNPDFNSSKPEDGSNFKNYKTHDGITFISNGHIVQFPDGRKIGMLIDREFAKKDGYRLSFYPQGFSRSELIELFLPESVKVTIWIPEGKK